jgi:hypothetical protein
MKPQYKLSLLSLLTTLTLVGCGGGSSDGDTTPASTDSGSAFISSLIINVQNSVNVAIKNQVGTHNPTDLKKIPYFYETIFIEPNIIYFSFRIDPDFPDSLLEVAYDKKSKKVIYSFFSNYSCYYDECNEIKLENFNELNGNAKIIFSKAYLYSLGNSSLNIDGTIEGNLYSNPLTIQSIPQILPSSLFIDGISTPIYSSTQSFTSNNNKIFSSLDLITADGDFFQVTQGDLNNILEFDSKHDNGVDIYKNTQASTALFSETDQKIQFNINNSTLVDQNGNTKLFNGIIQAPKSKSTLKVNNFAWNDLTELYPKDSTQNNILKRQYDYFDQSLVVMIKNKQIVSSQYTTADGTTSSCGLPNTPACTNISISSDYSTITFNNADLGGNKLNGKLDFNVR